MKLLRTWFAAALVVAVSGAISHAEGVIQPRLDDDVFEMTQHPDGRATVHYIWGTPAVVYQVSVSPGQVIQPGRPMFILKVKSAKVIPGREAEARQWPSRSKAHMVSGGTYIVEKVNIHLGQHIEAHCKTPLLILKPVPLAHDSVTQSADQPMKLSTLVVNLWKSTGIRDLIYQTGQEWPLGIGRLIMILVGLTLLYLAIFRGFEPLLLVPIGFGAIMANIPLAMLSGPDQILGMIYNVGVATGVFPLFIFMGVGAMTDFGPLIANPKTALLGAAAQSGIFLALLGALALSPICGFNLNDAASIGIIGGADGPTAIFLASRLSPNLLGAIAVAAYSYMALVPIIQPPIMRLLTTEKERRIKMTQLRPVSKLEKVCFPIIITLLCALLLPDAAPLISMLMFGNLLRECGVVERLNHTAQNAMINIVTILLGLAVGSKLSADKFLNVQTLGILSMGLVAFCVGTASGVILGKIMCRLSGGKINPLIGAAGVSAVPMAARVVNKVGTDEDPHNFLLMHAMGPNVAGVIGSAVAAGVLLNALRLIN